MQKEVTTALLVLLFIAGFMTVFVSKAVADQPVLVKVHLGNPYAAEELFTGDFDVVEYQPSYMKILVSTQQLSMLENKGYSLEYLSLSELFDQSVINKADAGLYHTYAETAAELHQIETTHSTIAKVYTIGKSIQGRDILALKISDNPTVEEIQEPEALYLGCHHAREWISVEIPLCLANYLVNNYGTDPSVKKLVDERQTWIVPIVNPDGLEYSQTVYTMWRKNMRDNNGNGVFDPSYDGVDINRNYGYKWGYDNVGSSPYPSAEDYRGKAAFSEPETQAIASLCVQHHFAVSISFHSYGEVMVYPWGYANLDTPDDMLFTDLAAKMAASNGYIYGNAKDGAMYNTNGEATDWMYATNGTFAYTFEVGTAFIPPENQIQQIWLQNKDTSLYLLQVADNPRQIYPTIKVYTDKPDYKQGDQMKVGINLTNTGNTMTVGIGVWVDLPGGDKYWVVQEPHVTVPKDFNYANAAWNSYVLPSLPPGTYRWHAMVVETSTMYILSESQATWTFHLG
jgi:carboxypeptidase T